MHWLKSFFSRLDPSRLLEGITSRFGFCSSSTCFIDSKKIVVVKFHGTADNIYEAMIERLVKELTEEQPAGLVLDLRKLKYIYGDDMGRVLCPAGEYDVPCCPVVVITSELNREGLDSLIRQEMFSKPALWLVEGEEQAQELMFSKLRHEDRRQKRKASSPR